jgi:hypothetical protein
MKVICSTQDCKNTVIYNHPFCLNCAVKQEELILKALEIYLSERFLLNEDYENCTTFKIFEHIRFKNKIQIQDYSPGFLKQFYGLEKPDITKEKIVKTINKLRKKDFKLYTILKLLWGMPINSYECHKSTVYRRLRRALLFIAIDTGLLKPIKN